MREKVRGGIDRIIRPRKICHRRSRRSHRSHRILALAVMLRCNQNQFKRQHEILLA